MVAAIDFYFDFSSPYGYLAAQRIEELARDHGRTVAWRPILLGPAMQASGNRPLLEQPLKGDYVRRDLARLARLMQVPFKLPPAFPFAAVVATRAFYWINDSDPGTARDFAAAVLAATFGEGLDVTDPAVLGAMGRELGIDPAAMDAAAAAPALKERVKAEVDASVERGVFGSPFFFVDGEPFWGADRLDMVDVWLETGGW